jgi:hypothetical protein
MKKCTIDTISKNSESLVNYEGIDIPVLYSCGANDVLVVIFHGATDQDKRPYPFFQNLGPSVAGEHRLSIADPTLSVEKKLVAAWYCGHQNLDLQKILPRFFEDLKKSLGIKRIVFTGGSSGGFAALFYSFHVADSVALALSPQTNLDNYLASAVGNYTKYCWPEIDDQSKLSSEITTDLRTIYAQKTDNLAIILNSSGDWTHVNRQSAPLLAAVDAKDHQTIIFQAKWHGVPSHSGSVPYTEAAPWIMALCGTDTWDAASVLASYTGYAPVQSARTAPQRDEKKGNAESYSKADIDKARLISDWILNGEQ